MIGNRDKGGFRTDWNLREGNSLRIQGDIYQGKAGMRDLGFELLRAVLQDRGKRYGPVGHESPRPLEPHSERYLRFSAADLLR